MLDGCLNAKDTCNFGYQPPQYHAGYQTPIERLHTMDMLRHLSALCSDFLRSLIVKVLHVHPASSDRTLEPNVLTTPRRGELDIPLERI